MHRRLLAAVLAGGLLAACRPAPAPRVAHRPLIVFAAASLGPALTRLTPVWATTHPEAPLLPSLAGTQELRTQIVSGAPADVLLSASVDDSRALRDAGLLDEPQPFVGNRLALAATTHNQTVRQFTDALRPGVKLVICGAKVPAGKYLTQALDALTHSGQPQQVAALRRNVKSEESDVAAARTKIGLGEVDAGFVYATDVIAAGLVDVPLPRPMQVQAKYTRARLKHSAQPDQAQALCDWLAGPEAKAVLQALGFTVDAM